MAAKSLTEKQLRATWAAYEAAKFNQNIAARALNMSRATLQSRLVRARDVLGLKEPERTEDYAGATAKARTLAEAVAAHRTKEEDKAQKARLKEATAEIAKLEARIKDLEYVASASFKPAEWATPARSAKPSEHLPYLLTSDFQVGEVIRAEETDHAVGYNTELFRSRYRRLIETTIYLSMEHGGSKWRYPGIIYARGGDTISGGIHEELRETDDLTPIQACEVAFEEEAAGILALAEAFGKVEVKDVGGGNHDRTSFKPKSKGANASSYDRLIGTMLRREFRKDKRVTFQITESPDIFFPIYGRNILLTHGDKIGSRGGQGFVGPAATILRGAKKVIMEQMAIGRIVHEVHMGHHHYPMHLSWVTCNGCLPGYSEYAKMFRMEPGPPQQWLFYHHPKHGCVDIKPIYLNE